MVEKTGNVLFDTVQGIVEKIGQNDLRAAAQLETQMLRNFPGLDYDYLKEMLGDAAKGNTQPYGIQTQPVPVQYKEGQGINFGAVDETQAVRTQAGQAVGGFQKLALTTGLIANSIGSMVPASAVPAIAVGAALTGGAEQVQAAEKKKPASKRVESRRGGERHGAPGTEEYGSQTKQGISGQIADIGIMLGAGYGAQKIANMGGNNNYAWDPVRQTVAGAVMGTAQNTVAGRQAERAAKSQAQMQRNEQRRTQYAEDRKFCIEDSEKHFTRTGEEKIYPRTSICAGIMADIKAENEEMLEQGGEPLPDRAPADRTKPHGANIKGAPQAKGASPAPAGLPATAKEAVQEATTWRKASAEELKSAPATGSSYVKNFLANRNNGQQR